MASKEIRESVKKHFLDSGILFKFQWIALALAANTYFYFPLPYSVISLAIVMIGITTYPLWRPEKKLLDAVLGNNIDLLRGSLKHRPEGLKIVSLDGETLLHWACYKSDLKVVHFLIQNNVDINALRRNKETPLHWAISSRDRDKVVYMISQGANLEVKDDAGRTPLFWAVSCSLCDIAEELVRCGADVSTVDNAGQNLMAIALKNDNESIIKMLNTFHDK